MRSSPCSVGTPSARFGHVVYSKSGVKDGELTHRFKYGDFEFKFDEES